jgi:hypothetical protein
VTVDTSEAGEPGRDARDALTVTESLAVRLVVGADAVAGDAVLRVLGLSGATGRGLPGRDLTGPGQRRGVSGTLHLVLVQRPEAVVDGKPGHAQQTHHHHRDENQRLTRLPAMACVVAKRMRESRQEDPCFTWHPAESLTAVAPLSRRCCSQSPRFHATVTAAAPGIDLQHPEAALSRISAI